METLTRVQQGIQQCPIDGHMLGLGGGGVGLLPTADRPAQRLRALHTCGNTQMATMTTVSRATSPLADLIADVS